MTDILAKDSIQNLYQENRRDYDSRRINCDGETVCISKEPVYLNSVSFSLTLFYNLDGLERAALVAENRQSDDRYRGLKPGHIHDMWLADLYGDPDSRTLFGIEYTRAGFEVYSEHDDENGNDVILIKYHPSDDRS